MSSHHCKTLRRSKLAERQVCDATGPSRERVISLSNTQRQVRRYIRVSVWNPPVESYSMKWVTESIFCDDISEPDVLFVVCGFPLKPPCFTVMCVCVHLMLLLFSCMFVCGWRICVSNACLPVEGRVHKPLCLSRVSRDFSETSPTRRKKNTKNPHKR